MAHATGEPLSPAPREAGWQCHRYYPGVRLNEGIGRLQAFAVHLASPVQLLEPPRGHVALVIGFGNPIRITPLTTPDTEGTYDSFVVGPDHPPLIIRYGGERTCFEILLSPCAAYELFGGGTQGLDGRVIPLDAILGDTANRLTEQLIVAASWGQRFALLEKTLARYLDRQPWQVRTEIHWAWHCLEQAGGAMPVSALVSALGWSHRHFVRAFQHYTGMTPKVSARYLRLAQALACLDQSPEEALAEVALECHYCDQSHLTREFQALAGCTPATYRQQCLGHFLPAPPPAARSDFFKTPPAPSA
ncbi:AraC family transcriptional regulator [Halomonas daqiaonensis]|uniref:Transcriptional regulator, AraC family n=1 Tax=Halomonas daqiaonensis TaxID=650850 RepID=A0A1H7SDM8_9GAMM|nr:AraC family transcriptional regulator [Halomonas daqiaonensis]SEL70722.1 transcriptional regulator, AraC family [Halomonas daqiaonensis]